MTQGFQNAQAIANEGATFSVGAKLPNLPTVGGAGSFGVNTPTTPFSLCGFKLPGPFPLVIAFAFPTLAIPVPGFLLAAGINCLSGSNPLNFAAGVAWGGGRKGTYDPDPDDPEP